MRLFGNPALILLATRAGEGQKGPPGWQGRACLEAGGDGLATGLPVAVLQVDGPSRGGLGFSVGCGGGISAGGVGTAVATAGGCIDGRTACGVAERFGGGKGCSGRASGAGGECQR